MILVKTEIDRSRFFCIRDRYASDVDITLQDRSVLSGKRLGEGKEQR
jgi:hypothetical protein